LSFVDSYDRVRYSKSIENGHEALFSPSPSDKISLKSVLIPVAFMDKIGYFSNYIATAYNKWFVCDIDF
jgi:hypothetical protein